MLAYTMKIEYNAHSLSDNLSTESEIAAKSKGAKSFIISGSK